MRGAKLNGAATLLTAAGFGIDAFKSSLLGLQLLHHIGTLL